MFLENPAPSPASPAVRRWGRLGFWLLLTILCLPTSVGAQVADRFTLPIQGFEAGSYANRDFWTNRHLGEDHAADPETPVYAIANGVIIGGGITGAHCNYGMVVVIEHELAAGMHAPDGSSHVVSVYGHLSNREGLQPPQLSGNVRRGQIIGYVGHSGGRPLLARCVNDDENGDGGPHLHLGLRLGRHPGQWVYYGYTGSGESRYPDGRFVAATDFIHNVGAAAPPGWWCEAIDQLADLGILTRRCDAFTVGDVTNRAEWATMISRTLRLSQSPAFDRCENPFSDVDPAEWYGPHIMAMAGLEYGDGATVYGVPADRRVRPADAILRCEAVKTLIEAWNPPRHQAPRLRYSDNDAIPDWCLPYLQQAVAHALVSAPAQGEARAFNPGAPTSAGESATMLVNAIESLGRPLPPADAWNNRCGDPVNPPEPADPCAAIGAANEGVQRGRLEGESGLRSACGGNGPEQVLRFVAPRAALWQMRTTGSGGDTVLYVRDRCPDGNAERACNDDAGGGDLTSVVQVQLNAGDTVMVIVDAFGEGPLNYQLTIEVSAQAEVCNGRDDDGDGQIDEGVTNACGQCGAVPEEICNGRDDNCDGRTDEGVTNACGQCGMVPVEMCNGRDDDCDGQTDEGCDNPAGEICNGVDDDDDGHIDEGVTNACGACGPVPQEICNGVDDDCNGHVDEGVTNACGACGPVPHEICNGVDDNCDGRVDEAVSNACGGCGVVPQEICNGLDDDCDGSVDEGVCTEKPPEEGAGLIDVCNGLDDDGNGHLDEDALCPPGTVCLGGACQWAPAGAADAGTSGGSEGGSSQATGCSTTASAPVGSTIGLLLLIAAVVSRRRWWALLGVVSLAGCVGVTEVPVERDFSVDAAVPEDQWVEVQAPDAQPDPVPDAAVVEGDAGCDPGEALPELDHVLCNPDQDRCPPGYKCLLLENAEADTAYICSPPRCIDRDGDSHGAGPDCEGSDCDDCDPTVYEGAAEVCDGRDNNCNGAVDEDLDPNLSDLLCPEWGVCDEVELRCQGSTWRCDFPPHYEDPEVSCDGLDNDCDGLVDNLDGLGEPCAAGEGACAREGVGVCDGLTGRLSCSAVPLPPVAERCNGLDDDCNGLIDDLPGVGEACNLISGTCESFGQRQCDRVRHQVVCNAPPPEVLPEVCDGRDNDCDGEVDEDLPGCPVGGNEICNNLDDDGDGQIDEDLTRACQGGCGVGVERCVAGAWGACNAPNGGLEVCNQLDDDCDGEIDEGVTNACGRCGPLEEICGNELDDDCNNLIDDGCPDCLGRPNGTVVDEGDWGECAYDSECAEQGQKTRTRRVCRDGQAANEPEQTQDGCHQNTGGIVVNEGAWGACDYNSQCAESGQKTRSNQVCRNGQPVNEPEQSQDGCHQNTGGLVVDEGAWGACDYNSQCAENGQKTRNNQVCRNGQSVNEPEQSQDGCHQNTSGLVVNEGAWGACDYNSECAESGQRTRNNQVCRNGQVANEQERDQNGCGRNRDGHVIEQGQWSNCDYVDQCDEHAQEHRANRVCDNGWPSNVQEDQGCDRNTDGQNCGQSRICDSQRCELCCDMEVTSPGLGVWTPDYTPVADCDGGGHLFKMSALGVTTVIEGNEVKARVHLQVRKADDSAPSTDIRVWVVLSGEDGGMQCAQRHAYVKRRWENGQVIEMIWRQGQPALDIRNVPIWPNAECSSLRDEDIKSFGIISDDADHPGQRVWMARELVRFEKNSCR